MRLEAILDFGFETERRLRRRWWIIPQKKVTQIYSEWSEGEGTGALQNCAKEELFAGPATTPTLNLLLSRPVVPSRVNIG